MYYQATIRVGVGVGVDAVVVTCSAPNLNIAEITILYIETQVIQMKARKTRVIV